MKTVTIESRFRIPSGTDIRSCSRHRFESLQYYYVI